MTAGRNVNSGSFDWCTPPKYVAAVQAMFDGVVELDPCSNSWSLVEARMEYSLPKHDGLYESWDFRTIYVNPPYGADRSRGTTIKNWLYKCASANQEYSSEVLALIPIAANTRHWKEYVWGAAAGVCFLYDTRLKFLENGSLEGKGAPMACAMVYWGQKFDKFSSIFMGFGAPVDIRNLWGKIIGQRVTAQQLDAFSEEWLTNRCS